MDSNGAVAGELPAPQERTEVLVDAPGATLRWSIGDWPSCSDSTVCWAKAAQFQVGCATRSPPSRGSSPTRVFTRVDLPRRWGRAGRCGRRPPAPKTDVVGMRTAS